MLAITALAGKPALFMRITPSFCDTSATSTAPVVSSCVGSMPGAPSRSVMSMPQAE